MGTFGKKIKELRQKKGISQKELGELFGLSESAIGMYERGYREPNNLELVTRFAEYFGVSNDYLLGKADNPYLIDSASTPPVTTDIIIDLKKQLDQYRQAVRAGKKVPYDGGFLNEKQIEKIQKFIDDFIVNN